MLAQAQALAHNIVVINTNLARIPNELTRLKLKELLHFWLSAQSNDETSIARQIELLLKEES